MAAAFAGAPASAVSSCTSSFSPVCAQCRRPIAPAWGAPTMKSKRERAPRPQPAPPLPSPPKRKAPRIDVDSSTLSLRQQLKLARAAAEPDAPVRVRQRFRRRKSPGTARSGGESGDDDAQVPDGKYDVEPDPVIFIDAYNVIGAWPRLRKHRNRSDMETARRLLLRDVAEFSHVRGWECVVVFDAHGNDDAIKTDVTPQNVGVVYTGSDTADSYIERQVFELVEEGRRQVWAATSDVAQLSFSSAKGAHVMTSAIFIQELKRAKKETKERVTETDESSVRGKMLMSNVDEETRNRLYALRDKLNG